MIRKEVEPSKGHEGFLSLREEPGSLVEDPDVEDAEPEPVPTHQREPSEPDRPEQGGQSNCGARSTPLHNADTHMRLSRFIAPWDSSAHLS